MAEAIANQSINFYIYVSVGVAWVAHLLISFFRLLKMFKNMDMRLNVRFVEKGSETTVRWGIVVWQIVATVIVIALTLYALFR